jgi:predicted dehydrogenase
VSDLAFGIIGCGLMGARRAATVAANRSASLIAAADTVQAKAQRVAADFHCQALNTAEELLELDEIDAVFVCTQNVFHAPLAIEAMRKGKHVICEKPLACTPVEAMAMVREAKSSGVTLKVGSNLRYFDNIRQARDFVVGGEVGELLFFRGFIGNNGWPREGWYGDPALAGGGTVLDNGCHLFDLIRWTFGEVESCFGQVMNLNWELEVEDNGTAIFTTSSGQLASVHSSWTEWKGYVFAQIYGSNGMVEVRNDGEVAETILVQKSGKRRHFDFTSKALRPYDLELEAYLLARANGEVPAPDGYAGLRAVEMASAVYASSRTGRQVKVGI